MSTLILVLQIASYTIAGGVVALKAIAPLTKTTKDDEALGWLEKVELFLHRILPIPAPSPKVAERLAPAKED